jgi:hypothetical protein
MDSERSNLLKFVSSQNDHLVKSIIEIEDKKTTANQISNYKNEQVTWFHHTNRVLLYFYYFLALVLIYLLYIKIEITRYATKNTRTWNFGNVNPYSYRKKKKFTTIAIILIMFVLFIFPHVINKIEIVSYNILRYIWTFIMCIEYQYQQ